MKIFISWSEAESSALADVFSLWLPYMFDHVETFISSKDIDKGTPWGEKLMKELEECDLGLMFITKTNYYKPWLYFELGALAFVRGYASVNICPILYDVKDTDYATPLKNFQATEFNEEDIFQLITTINAKLDKPLEKDILKEKFDLSWVNLKNKSNEVLEQQLDKDIDIITRDNIDMLSEMLDMERNNETKLTRIEKKLDEGLFSKEFVKCNSSFHGQVFPHYLNQDNNCLDYLALCKGNSVIDDSINPKIDTRLKRYSINSNPTAQSIKYKELAIRYQNIIKSITNELEMSEVDQGSLLKLAFDLEIGGIFYYMFDDDKEEEKRYLFGATIDQASMDDGVAYKEMELIFNDLGGKRRCS